VWSSLKYILLLVQSESLKTTLIYPINKSVSFLAVDWLRARAKIKKKGKAKTMWAFSSKDLDEGAQERMVAASDFRGPKKVVDRIVTDSKYIYILFIGMVYCIYCGIAPTLIRHPNSNKLLFGTDYSGEFLSLLIWQSYVCLSLSLSL
jgi:hypothetical protein